MIQTDIKLVCDGPFCLAKERTPAVFLNVLPDDGPRQMRNLAWLWGWRRVPAERGGLTLDLCPFCMEEVAKQ
jgi:hypothetical protein